MIRRLPATLAVFGLLAAPVAVLPDASRAGRTGQYLGCFSDQGASHGLRGRDLGGASSQDNPQMTVDRCLRFCTVMGYRYAGLQYANSCFCGNQYGTFGSSRRCGMACAGDSEQICGGSWANSIYHLGGLPPP